MTKEKHSWQAFCQSQIPAAADGASEPGEQASEALSFGKAVNGESIQPDSVGGSSRATIIVRLPSAVAAGSEFVVEGRLAQNSVDKIAQFRVESSPPIEVGPYPDAPSSRLKRVRRGRKWKGCAAIFATSSPLHSVTYS